MVVLPCSLEFGVSDHMPHELDITHGILTQVGVRVVHPVLSGNHKKSVTSFDAFNESHGRTIKLLLAGSSSRLAASSMNMGAWSPWVLVSSWIRLQMISRARSGEQLDRASSRRARVVRE